MTDIYGRPNYGAFFEQALGNVGAAMERRQARDLAERNYAQELEAAQAREAYQEGMLGIAQERERREAQAPIVAGNVVLDPTGTKTLFAPAPKPELSFEQRLELKRTGPPRAAAGAGRPLPQNVIKALTETGTALTDIDRFEKSFKDDYAVGRVDLGGGVEVGAEPLGQLSNWIARFTSLGNKEAAQWWSDYDASKIIIRNKLFGSALTALERRDFDAANITPGMEASVIRANLARQHDAALRAAKKLAGVHAAQGVNPNVIEPAIGSEEIDVTAPSGDVSEEDYNAAVAEKQRILAEEENVTEEEANEYILDTYGVDLNEAQ